MNIPSESVKGWARRLLAAEAANQSVSDTHIDVAVRVSDKLRVSLTRFAGADGFTALLRRALVLARADVPSLRTVTMSADGRLEGMESCTADGRGVEAATAIIEHLLGLLVTFIGEPLTLRLVREAWPDTSWDETL